jgi:hypothetical protein
MLRPVIETASALVSLITGRLRQRRSATPKHLEAHNHDTDANKPFATFRNIISYLSIGGRPVCCHCTELCYSRVSFSSGGLPIVLNPNNTSDALTTELLIVILLFISKGYRRVFCMDPCWCLEKKAATRQKQYGQHCMLLQNQFPLANSICYNY